MTNWRDDWEYQEIEYTEQEMEALSVAQETYTEAVQEYNKVTNWIDTLESMTHREYEYEQTVYSQS
jgi:hypothetical protein